MPTTTTPEPEEFEVGATNKNDVYAVAMGYGNTTIYGYATSALDILMEVTAESIRVDTGTAIIGMDIFFEAETLTIPYEQQSKYWLEQEAMDYYMQFEDIPVEFIRRRQ